MNAKHTPTNLDDQLSALVQTYSDDAPDAPTVDEIITRRAERLAETRTTAQPARRLFGPALGFACLLVAVAISWAFLRDDGSVLIETPADTPTTDTSRTVTSTTVGDPGEVTSPVATTEPVPEVDPFDPPADVARPPLPDGRPSTFWAITQDTYELVEVETLTGEIVGRYGGWGGDPIACGNEEGCIPQAIDDIELGHNGRLWVGDCCEPAVGNVFAVEPGSGLVPGVTPSIYGSRPSVSPNGTLIAVTALNTIQVRRTDGDLSDEPLVSFRPTQNEGEPDISWTPAGWLDDTTLILQATFETSTLTLLDISDPANPVHSTDGVGGLLPFTGLAVRSDGAVVVAAYLPKFISNQASSTVTGWVYDMLTGERIAEFDLPDSTIKLDYDSTGTYLIVTGRDGVVSWFGAGKSGEIAQGLIAASW